MGQQKGLEREARVKQDEALIKQVLANEVKVREYKERVKQKAKEREAMRAMCCQVDKRLAKAKEDIRYACSTAKMLRRMDETKLHATLGHSSNKYSSHKRIVLPTSDEVSGRSFAEAC